MDGGGGWLGVGDGWGWRGGWMGVGDGWGVPPTHVHTHAHARTCMHAHACVVSMIISCKWPPPLGESLEIPYDVIRTCACVRMHARVCACMHVCACACMCTCVGYTLSPPPTPHPHPPTSPSPRGDPWNQSKFNSTSTN